ncbi:MAG: SMC-Scp complex subunit ScpB, partial [Sphingomonadales bacterium]|nr:SMC-Scp complex subunit ScpB [Sphingomonadales bacterium]
MMGERDDTSRAVEAVLFASEESLTLHEISQAVGEDVDVPAVLERLEEEYADRGFALVKRGSRWHFETAPDMAHVLRRERDEPRKLSRAALETLAIIAYHEPVSR